VLRSQRIPITIAIVEFGCDRFVAVLVEHLARSSGKGA